MANVETEFGIGRLHRFRASGPTKAVVALGHGAGGGIDSRDLTAIAESFAGSDLEIVLIEQPWVVEGKKVAPAPARLDACWLPLVRAAHRRDLPLIVGGRSAGARVACRTATDVGASGILALAFPLHPPGRPAKSRIDELTGSGLPTVVVQGARDPFGSSRAVKANTKGNPAVTVVSIAAADHGFKVPAAATSTTDRALKQITAGITRESWRWFQR
ncbi:MAG: alpha/beta family hydrolase [Candidatus Nanopelagicales bacterium]